MLDQSAMTVQRPESVSGRRGPRPVYRARLNFQIKLCHSTGIARWGSGAVVTRERLKS